MTESSKGSGSCRHASGGLPIRRRLTTCPTKRQVMMDRLMIGQTVSKYRLLAEIGRGSMGIVFKAQDTFLGRSVAIKILAEKLVDNPEMLRRFEREGGAASALNHPNICTVFEAG